MTTFESLAKIADARHGGAFAALAQLHLQTDTAGRAELEAAVEASLGPNFLGDWKEWCRRHREAIRHTPRTDLVSGRRSRPCPEWPDSPISSR